MYSAEYFAGFFDGEGSIGIYLQQNSSYHLRVQVTQLYSAESIQLLQEVKDAFGGSLNTWLNGREHRTLHYQVNSDKALALLIDVLPHLRLKREQAELAIAWQQSKLPVERDPHGRVVARSKEYTEAARVVAENLKSLKRPLGVVKG